MTIGIQQITLFLLVSWFFMYVTARYQQDRIKKSLFKRIEEGLGPALRKDPHLNLEKFYTWVFADWDQLVRENAWFVLSKSELYPIPARPEQLKIQMNLTPSWLGAYLRLQGKNLQMSEALEESVQKIIQSLPEKRRQELLEP